MKSFAYLILLLVNVFILFNLSNDLFIPVLYTGDFLSVISVFKQIIMGDLPFIGVPKSLSIGAPYEFVFGDYPMPMMSVWLYVKMLSIFTSNHFLIVNIFIWTSFILNPLTMYYVLRRFRVNIFVAIVVATLYNVLPFHFFRISHTLYIGYWLLPLMTYVLLLMQMNKPLFYKYSTDKKYKFDLNNRNIFIILILIFGSTWNYYYTFFFLILVGIIVLIRLIEQKNRYFLYSGLIVIGLSIMPFFINMIPYKLYTMENGKNLQVAQRGIGESEIYGLKISQLLLPTNGHRLTVASELKEKYSLATPLNNENHTATLGIMGSLGFLILILYLFIQERYTTVFKKLSYLNISALLFATIGGFGSLFALFVTPAIRGYNRISILIATFTLMAFALFLNYLIKKYNIKPLKVVVLCILILGIGMYDQIPRGATLTTDPYWKMVFESDKKFIKKIEALHDKNKQGMIMQYPYMSYPEQPPIVNMPDYAQMVGYLHSETLRWSYGAVRGRESDAWIQNINKYPFEKQIDILKSSGFSGIYIDRRGYMDKGVFIEKEIRAILGSEPLVSDDGFKSFFKIKPTDNKIYKFPYTPEFIAEFHGWEDPHGSFGWASGDAILKVTNNKGQKVLFSLKMNLGTLEDRKVVISSEKKVLKQVDLNASILTDIDLTFQLLPGDNMIYFKTDVIAKVPGNGDPRKMTFNVQNMTYHVPTKPTP